ncbi:MULTISPECIES: FAD-dependent oxidoreductase [Sphingomonas]|uniref:FAD-dependent oxidoreductase n=1 Tax=Sphingomonas TaxID=13687 RepID=UPI0013B3C6BF|nr:MULTISPECIES: FAD-dependent oxidoreductase [Sphingomonas]
MTRKRQRGTGPATSRRDALALLGGAVGAPGVLRAAPRGSAARVAVVGAGVFGAWTAEYLRRAGHQVTLVDAAGPAHSRASSGGESRLTRAAYGQDLVYSRMALASLAEWQRLSNVAGLPILHQCGVLFFFPREEAYLRDSIAAHHQLGIPSVLLEPAALACRFPMIDFSGIVAGLFEPQFGALMARRAVQTLVQGFVAAGGHYRQARVMPPRASGDQLGQLHLSDGSLLEADRFVFAAGPWLPKLLPDLLARKIVATRQEVFYFAPPDADPRFEPAAMPGWADFNGGDIFYGFPDLEGRGVKFAHDAHGVEVDPDTQSRRPTEAALVEVTAYRDRRFPLLRNAPLLSAEVCQYENSSNGDFLIDRHPLWRDTVLVGGGSGHGFKHGPEVGRLAASLVTGGPRLDPRLRLDSKQDNQARAVH